MNDFKNTVVIVGLFTIIFTTFVIVKRLDEIITLLTGM